MTKKILQRFDELLYENAYNIIYKELSPKERELVRYAVINNQNSYIIETMNISKAQLSNYKKTLVQKGLLIPDRNKIVFKLPHFKEYLEFIKELEE